MPFVAQYSFGTTVARLGPVNSVTLRCFVPLSVHLTLVSAEHRFSRSVMLLLPAVHRCRYAILREVLATPSSGDGAGICSSFAYTPNQLVFRHTPKMTFSSCYNE